MRVTILKTGETIGVEDCYGLRLIEQGQAVIAPEPAPEPEAAPEKTEKKTADKGKKKE